MRLLFRLYLICLLVWPTAAYADNVHIVAEVNGEAITNYEVENRVALLTSTRDMPNTPQVKAQILSHALQMLVNEAVQRQYAKEKNIKVKESDIETALNAIGEQNGVPAGQFKDHVLSLGVPLEALMAQVNAQVLWQKVIAREIRPRVQVSEFEVEDALDQIKDSLGEQKEYYLSEIVLSVDENDPAATQSVAEDIVSRLNEGESFGELATQFSVAASKQEAGALGWVPEKQIPEALRTPIKVAEPNSVLAPITDEKSGLIRILKVGNSRDAASNLSTQEARIRELLMARAIEKQTQALMKNLRQKSFVEFR